MLFCGGNPTPQYFSDEKEVDYVRSRSRILLHHFTDLKLKSGFLLVLLKTFTTSVNPLSTVP